MGKEQSIFFNVKLLSLKGFLRDIYIKQAYTVYILLKKII